MSTTRYILGLALVGLTTGVVRADIYEDVKSSIAINNHELNKLRNENLSEYYGLKVENSLSGLEVDYDNLWAKGSVEHRWGLSVSQEFDFPVAYIARNKELKARREAMDLSFQSALANCLLQAYELLIEISYCNKVIDLERNIVDDMERLSSLLKLSFEHGETTILDVNRSKIEQANSVIKLREHESRRDQCVSQLKSLGYNLVDIEGVTYPLLEFGSREYYMQSIDKNPLVEYYESQKRAELYGIKARRAENLPSVKLGYVHEYEENTSFNGFSVGISLPAWSTRSRVAQARAKTAAVEKGVEAARIECEAAIDAEYTSATVNKELYDILAPVFYNNNNIQLLRKAFEGGQMTAIDYLREIEYFRESEDDFLTIEYQYQTSLARLNKFQLLLKQ